MSGLYKLMNFFLFMAFGGLGLVLADRFTSPVESSLPVVTAPKPGVPSAAGAGDSAGASATPSVKEGFSNYSSVIDQNLFASDRKPWAPEIEPTPEPPPEETPVPEPLELPASLKLTGVFLLGKTKMAFFNEGGAVGGGPMTRNSMLQQRLAQQQLQQGAAAGFQRGNRGAMPTPTPEPTPGADAPAGPRHGYLEGETVQGLLLREIRQTDVLLEKDGQQAALSLTQEPPQSQGAVAGPIKNPQGGPAAQRNMDAAARQQRLQERLQKQQQRRQQLDPRLNPRGNRRGNRQKQMQEDAEAGDGAEFGDDGGDSLPDEEFMDDSASEEENIDSQFESEPE